MSQERTSLDLEHLACSVCLEYLLPPLYICLKGHSTACGMCFSKLGNEPECPTCRSKITKMRNFSLEGIIRNAPLPCKFKEAGCMSKPTGDAYLAHILNCKFCGLVNCPFKMSTGCPSSNCGWVGALPRVPGHLKDHHGSKVIIATGNCSFIFENILNAPRVVAAIGLLESDERGMDFLLHVRKKDHEVNVVVQGLGTAAEMDDFNFTLGMLAENPRCSLRWDSFPISITEKFGWKSSKSVWSVPVEMAKAFQSNGSIHMLLEIQPVTVNSV